MPTFVIRCPFPTVIVMRILTLVSSGFKLGSEDGWLVGYEYPDARRIAVLKMYVEFVCLLLCFVLFLLDVVSFVSLLRLFLVVFVCCMILSSFRLVPGIYLCRCVALFSFIFLIKTITSTCQAFPFFFEVPVRSHT